MWLAAYARQEPFLSIARTRELTEINPMRNLGELTTPQLSSAAACLDLIKSIKSAHKNGPKARAMRAVA